MPKKYQKKTKLTPKQQEALAKAQQVLQASRGQLETVEQKKAAKRKKKEEVEKLREEVKFYKEQAREEREKKWSERRRYLKMRDARDAQKAKVKKAKAETRRMQGLAEKQEKELNEMRKAEKEGDEHIQQLERCIMTLQAAVKDLTHRRVILWKRYKRLIYAKSALKKRLSEKIRSHPSVVFRMKRKGRYTVQVRLIASLIVASGTAEAKVGETLQAIGNTLGVEIKEIISKRTVHRSILERGVAADIQLVYKIIKSQNITYSSDSMSHKHIEYECQTLALKVVDYSDPDAEPEWTLRTLGLGTSVNHMSEVQVAGLQARLEQLAEIFNNSPFAKREGLHFVPDDFAYHLIGTSGDHVADQKKSHELLRIWQLEVILQRLGEEALLDMDPGRVFGVLIRLKAKMVEEYGGQEAWDMLSEAEKAEGDTQIVRELGRQVFEMLPKEEQDQLTRFICTGCCMHKDLNCFKAGAKALDAMWKNLKKTPPVTLANKDNARVLENANPDVLTESEQSAEAASRRGGCYAAFLGGQICRNKDTKKGQQETYNIWMEQNIGHRVPYPDVSNTRYGSHGDAAATIIVYHEQFLKFMKFVRDVKDKPIDSNIEKNFTKALKDIPTLTELCVLALYNVAVSRPFMQHIRTHDNILSLEDFFSKKSSFLQSLIDDPKIWTGDDISHETGSLGGVEWEAWSQKVLAAVKTHASKLPDLDSAVVAFVSGARETFVERFSDEFKPGNGIDQLTTVE